LSFLNCTRGVTSFVCWYKVALKNHLLVQLESNEPQEHVAVHNAALNVTTPHIHILHSAVASNLLLGICKAKTLGNIGIDSVLYTLRSNGIRHKTTRIPHA
jgi:hypothetical protein